MNGSAESQQNQNPTMNFNGTQGISQEEERRILMMNNNSSSSSFYGGGVTEVKVVEYMLSSMSNDLLCKFPDNSAFDFDYTQSSIWSPLVPHPSNPSSPAPDLQRKLSYEDEEQSNSGKLTSVKDNFSDLCVFNCFKVHHKFSKKKMMMKRRRSSFRGFDHLGSISSNSSNLVADPESSSPIQIKGWKKVLKAASKQFKKTMKKKESGTHVKLSSDGYSHYLY